MAGVSWQFGRGGVQVPVAANLRVEKRVFVSTTFSLHHWPDKMEMYTNHSFHSRSQKPGDSTLASHWASDFSNGFFLPLFIAENYADGEWYAEAQY